MQSLTFGDGPNALETRSSVCGDYQGMAVLHIPNFSGCPCCRGSCKGTSLSLPFKGNPVTYCIIFMVSEFKLKKQRGNTSPPPGKSGSAPSLAWDLTPSLQGNW